MNVNDLIEYLQALVNNNSDIGKMHIRVIEETEFEDDGEAKDNHWVDSQEDIIVCSVSNTSMPSDENYTGEIVIRGMK